MDKTHRVIQLTALILGILVPSILLAGYIFHLGYSQTFGLDSSLVYKSLADMMTEAWYLGVMILIYLVPKWWYLVVALFFYILLILVLFLYFSYLKKQGKTWFTKEITKDNQGAKFCGLTLWRWGHIYEIFEELSSWFLIPAIILLFAASLTVFPYQQGRDGALKQITEHQKYNCEAKEKQGLATRCHYLIDTSTAEQKIIAQGILVAANNNRVALFDNNIVEVWPILDSYIIRRFYLEQPSEQTD